VRCGVPTASVVNSWSVDDLLRWTADHDSRPAAADVEP
jgi:hypothetical protein